MNTDILNQKTRGGRRCLLHSNRKGIPVSTLTRKFVPNPVDVEWMNDPVEVEVSRKDRIHAARPTPRPDFKSYF